MYSFIPLFFFLIYAPVYIAKIIDDNWNLDFTKLSSQETKNYFKFLSLVLIQQMLIYVFLTLFLVLLFYIPLIYIKNFETFNQLEFINNLNVDSYFIGSLLGALMIIFSTIYFLTKTGNFNISLGIIRGSTRVGLFAIVGLLLSFLYDIIFIEITIKWLKYLYIISTLILIGFFIQKLLTLMLIVADRDSYVFESKDFIFNRFYQRTKKLKHLYLILIIVFSMLLWMALNYRELDYLIDSIYFIIITIPLSTLSGFIVALFPTPIFFRTFAFSIYKIYNIKSFDILSKDEVSNSWQFHKNLINTIEQNKPLFFQTLEKYYKNSSYSTEILKLFLETIDSKDFNKKLLLYLNNSNDISLINLEKSQFNNLSIYEWKNQKVRETFFELNQIVDTNPLKYILSEKSSSIEYITFIQNQFTNFQYEIEWITEFNSIKDKVIKKFNINSSSYLHKLNENIFDTLLNYFQEKFNSEATKEVSLEFLEKQLIYSNEKAVLTFQITNTKNQSVELINIKPLILNKEIDIDNFKFEKHKLLANRTEQYLLNLVVQKETTLRVEVQVTYNIKNDKKIKVLKQNIPIILIKEFKEIENPYTTAPVIESEMFFGREQHINSILQKVNSKTPSSIITITAERRMGKTSLLKYLQKTVKEFDIVFIDMHSLMPFPKSSEEFIDRILSYYSDKFNKNFKNYEKISYSEFFKLLSNSKIIFLLDEFDVFLESIEEKDRELFLRTIRNFEILNKPIFVFSLPRNKLNELDLDSKNIMYSQAIYTLYAFDKITSYKLITEPIKDKLILTSEVVEHIYSLCGGYPIYLQAYSSALVDYNNAFLQSNLIDMDLIKEFESNNAENFASFMEVFLQSLSVEYVNILKVFDKNSNSIEIKNIENEILKFYPIKNISDVIEKMLRENIIDSKGDSYFCTSRFLLDALVEIS